MAYSKSYSQENTANFILTRKEMSYQTNPKKKEEKKIEEKEKEDLQETSRQLRFF